MYQTVPLCLPPKQYHWIAEKDASRRLYAIRRHINPHQPTEETYGNITRVPFINAISLLGYFNDDKESWDVTSLECSMGLNRNSAVLYWARIQPVVSDGKRMVRCQSYQTDIQSIINDFTAAWLTTTNHGVRMILKGVSGSRGAYLSPFMPSRSTIGGLICQWPTLVYRSIHL